MEGLKHVNTPRDETVVEVDKAKEFMKFTLHDRLGKVADDTDLLLKRADALAVNLVTKELQPLHPEHTLGQLLEDGQTMPSCSMWSNSWHTALRRSGASLQVRALTGGPVVLIWCVTLHYRW